MALPTPADLRRMLPSAGDRLTPHLPYIVPALEWGKVEDSTEVAAFMAHVAHESGEYRYMREIADGSQYEGRTDLGNIYPGDGHKYPGRGAIQVTGRDAARAAGRALGAPFEDHPELMELPEWATKVSVWFWTKFKPWLPPAARLGWFHVTQRLVNGGNNGWPERVVYYQHNLGLLGLPSYEERGETQKIKQFQTAHGLFADGAVGPLTLAKLL